MQKGFDYFTYNLWGLVHKYYINIDTFGSFLIKYATSQQIANSMTYLIDTRYTLGLYYLFNSSHGHII